MLATAVVKSVCVSTGELDKGKKKKKKPHFSHRGFCISVTGRQLCVKSLWQRGGEGPPLWGAVTIVSLMESNTVPLTHTHTHIHTVSGWSFNTLPPVALSPGILLILDQEATTPVPASHPGLNTETQWCLRVCVYAWKLKCWIVLDHWFLLFSSAFYTFNTECETRRRWGETDGWWQESTEQMTLTSLWS